MTVYSVTAKPIKARSRVRQGRGLSLFRVAAMNDYRNAHNRIKRLRGRAAVQICADCKTASADTWSYNGGSPFEQCGNIRVSTRGRISIATVRWSANVWDYSPRCTPCHRAYDIRFTVSDLDGLDGLTLKEQAHAIGCSTTTVGLLRRAQKEAQS